LNTDLTILYLSYDGLTDPLGQSQILPYLLGLEERGFSFYLITAEKQEVYQRKKEEIGKQISGKNLHWFPVVYHASPPVVSTLWDLWVMYRKAILIVKKHPISIIHGRSYLSALIGMQIKKEKGIRFLFDMRGFWADERVEGGLWNLNNPLFRLIYRFFKGKEKKWFEQADHIISLTHTAADIIRSQKGVSAAEITVIPCCADLKHFQPTLSKKGNYMLYLGSLGTWYMLEEMLALYQVAQELVPGLRFMILSKEPPILVEKAAKSQGLKLDTIEVREVIRAEIPSLISASMFAVYFIRPGYSKKASSATKLAEILACGVPVISNAGIGDHELIFKDLRAGVLLQEFNSAAYHTALQSLLQKNWSADDLRLKAKEWFDLEMGIDRYEKVYQKMSIT
jgi:glycosyltransferase involved in cell wall biosynthesis